MSRKRRRRVGGLNRSEEMVMRRIYKRCARVEQGYRCFYCFCPLSLSATTADHLIPLIDRGRTIYENIKAACERCNGAKATMHWQTFMDLIMQPVAHLTGALAEIAWDRWMWQLVWSSSERIAAQVGIDAAPVLIAMQSEPATTLHLGGQGDG